MRTEARFILAIGLMLLVVYGTNFLFPAPEPVAAPGADTAAVQVEPDADPSDEPALDLGADAPAGGAAGLPGQEPAPEVAPAVPERLVAVESPLYRYTFSTRGGRLVGAELLNYRGLRGEEGPVQLIPDPDDGAFGHRLVVGSDTVDLRDLPFELATEVDGDLLGVDAPEETLRFVYQAPSGFGMSLEYIFKPGSYLVDVEARVEGVERALVLTSLGDGLRFTEADSASEAGMMAWVGNHVADGIDSHPLRKVDEAAVYEGPFLWAAFKSKFFVLAALPQREEGGDDYFGGVLVRPGERELSAELAVAQNLGSDGLFDYQIFAGPQEYARLSALGDDLEEVNPYGWRFFRPIIRPFVAVVIWVLNFLHDTLQIGYGWVLILFGLIMRILLWPLNQKAMRAQMRNMAVQPMLKEIQTKYKDQPEKLQKEMMKLYKEYGFNPLAGCLPLLLPWPILIALFFVFQNTIELRGVEFLWLPDLSAADPYYILPIFLALSMFALQFISFRSMDQNNPQMKMMMYFMPLFFGFIFMNFASGLNLYYATSNIATIPQQLLIAKEREKAKERGPVKRSEQE